MEHIKKIKEGLTMGKAKVVQITKGIKQSGITPNLAIDSLLKAMYPGKRISSSGKEYWETRKNRSDKDYDKKL